LDHAEQYYSGAYIVDTEYAPFARPLLIGSSYGFIISALMMLQFPFKNASCLCFHNRGVKVWQSRK